MTISWSLTASRDLRFLLQEVLEKQMTSRGYMIGPNGAVDLQIIVNKLYADVSQGNVRYNIATKADIAIIATAANGTKMTKNYRASYSVEGAFRASNKNIADAVNSVLTDTIADMAQDTSIHDFIKQNALSRTRPPPGSCYAMSSHYYAFSAAEISHFADPWFRLRSAAGPHLRYPASLDDGGKYRSENDRFFSLVGRAYVFKFLWSPLMDRYTPPFLGRRRGWLLTTGYYSCWRSRRWAFLSRSPNYAGWRRWRW